MKRVFLILLQVWPVIVAAQAFEIPFEKRYDPQSALSGECGPVNFKVQWEQNGAEATSQVILLAANGRVLSRRKVRNHPHGAYCEHEPIRGVRTLQFVFGRGGSSVAVDMLWYRVSPLRPLLSISLVTHADLVSPTEFLDVDGDGQQEIIVRDGKLGSALCQSCDYDADTVEYLLCYSEAGYHECANQHANRFRQLIEKGFSQLANPREQRHRLAWSLFILFHAEQIGETEKTWARLEQVLQRDFLEKVNARRPRITSALALRDRSWSVQ